MEYIYSALLLHHLGKEITEDNLKKILTAAGTTVDEAKLKALIASLKEVNIEDAINAQPAPQQQSAPVEEKKEVKEETKEDEGAAAAGLASLFG